MPVQLMSPKDSLHPVPYHHVAIGSGARQIVLAGQTARDPDGGPIVDRGLSEQVSDALRQVGIALEAAGASFSDVVRLTCYVPNWDSAAIGPFTEGIESVVSELAIPQPWPPLTVIGVAALWEPDILVEIEATAVLD